MKVAKNEKTPQLKEKSAVAPQEQPRGQRRLVVVSNRIPLSFTTEDGKSIAKLSSGGLVSALEPLLREHGGVWIGAAGTEDSPEIREQLQQATKDQHHCYEPLFLTPEEQEKYYEGFSNEVLWPLFHDLQTRCVFQPDYWDFYQSVNRKFADTVAKTTRAEDLIWIQDYQLMQVATSLRKLRPNSSIAFFLHIPFPAPDIFEKLPWRKELLQGLLDHDFVGLQTDRDLHNLVACLRSRLPRVTITGRGNKRKVTGLRGTTILQAMPISIDYTEFAHMAASAEIKKRASQLREDLGGLQLILGVDRLDYTKGIPERLRAYHALLRDQPQLCGKISMIQIAIPSREGIEEYQELRAEIERLVSSINGDLSQPGWIPVQYMYRSVPREELIALYRCADIALITPLKDGMNLVAKEYCAAQVDQNGILVLSEFAGAAPELRNAAILVNPYDEVGTAGALRQAIEMPAQERRQRMARLRRQVREADILHWRDSFFTSFEKLESRR